MVSLLESTIRNEVAKAFRGQLLTCTLRRVPNASLDAAGDVVAGAPQTWTFDGIVDGFSAYFANREGIPLTDARVLIIAGSLATVPEKDDQVKCRDEWFQLRRLVDRDPANASYTFSGFKIEDPT